MDSATDHAPEVPPEAITQQALAHGYIYQIIQYFDLYYRQQHSTIAMDSNSNPKTKKIAKDGKQRHNNQSSNDRRFQAANYDPKFVAPGSAITKVKIDQRFADKMKSDKFQMAGGVDKYGRANVGKSQLAGMADYYYTEDKQDQHTHQKQGKKKVQKQTDSKKSKMPIRQVEQEVSQNQEQNITDWMQNYNQQSSDDMQQQDYDELAQQSDGVWSDDENVIKGEDVQVTRRLALCNYDWMNINAKDLMLLFSSFKPAAGTVVSVSVYYSEIGKQKLKLEEKFGPQGIWNKQEQKLKQKDNDKSTKNYKNLQQQDNKDEQAAFDPRKLRLYEKQRLKYCYAVIQCNNNKTADEIYRECDGNQFQSSNLLFDLRFIPDDLKFDQKMLKEKCNQIPVSGQVKNFVSRALGHSKVNLTWEDPELNGIANLKKKNWNKMTQQQLDKIDWGMYINEQAEQADDNFNKLVKNGKDNQTIQQQDQKMQQAQIVTDWRKECNKKYKRDYQDDDLQIIFPSGFQKQASSKKTKTKKQRWESIKQQKKKKRQQIQLLVQKDDKQQFAYNPEDERFKAVFNDPKFSIDPVNPKFDHRKVGNVFQEVVKRNKSKNHF